MDAKAQEPAALAAKLRAAVASAQQTLKHAVVLASLGLVFVVVGAVIVSAQRQSSGAMLVLLLVGLGIQGLTVALWYSLWRGSLRDPRAVLPNARIWAILAFLFSVFGGSMLGIVINAFIWYRVHQGKKALDHLGAVDPDGAVYSTIFD